MTKLDNLFGTLNEAEPLFIMPHTNPDPDALASAAALQSLLMQQFGLAGRLSYSGIIGRAENKALARYLGIAASAKNLLEAGAAAVVLVDTQPGAGNIVLPPLARVVAVIDHHQPHPDAAPAKPPPFVDLRPDVGATSTLLVEYFEAAGLPLSQMLATALFYGIKTNTMGLSRNAGRADAAAYYRLQPQIDVEALGKIEQARVPPHYFKTFDAALRHARLYGHLVFSDLGPVDYPDLTAEMADWLLRLERAHWVVCVGVYHHTLIISVRTRRRRDNAEQLALAMVNSEGVAGGHGTIAGGQIPLDDRNAETLMPQLTNRALLALNLPPDTPDVPLF
ncbi:MAG: DHHA1 domain-containing protein [Anaerolineae bacterium]